MKIFCYDRNLFILTIVPRAKVRVSRSAKLYYSVIALADLLELLVGTVIWSFLDDGLLLLTGDRFSVRIARYSDVTCKLVYLFNELAENLSNYTIVALAIERCLIIFFPLRAKRFALFRFSVMLIALLVAPAWLSSIISVPVIVILKTNMTQFSQSGCECEKDDEHSLTATFTVMLTIFTYMLHVVLNIILVTVISIKLAHIRYQRTAMIRDNLIHITARKNNVIINKRLNNLVESSVEHNRGFCSESLNLNPKHNQHNGLDTLPLTDISNEIDPAHYQSNSTKASNLCSESPRIRFEFSPSVASRPNYSPGGRDSESPYKCTVKTLPLLGNTLQIQPQHPTNSCISETPETSSSKLNSCLAKPSQISTGNLQHISATCLTAPRFDSVPEHSELYGSCSISEERCHSPQIVRKPVEIRELEPEHECVLHRDVNRVAHKRPAPSIFLSRELRHEQPTAQDSLEVRALNCSSASGISKIQTLSASSGGVGSGGGPSDGGVAIGATVVMVLLASISVVIYLPAAMSELAYLLTDQDALEPSTRNMLSSLGRFLFENLCFAHALNFFVYVGRYEGVNECKGFLCFLNSLLIRTMYA